jgi:hypothetical protein
MSNVIEFVPKTSGKEPMDEVEVCAITVTGKGDVSIWVNDYIETMEQHNWLIAKIAAASAAVIDRKNA